jgi:putative NADPH-quinone reductase
MGMPALVYRWYFRAHSVESLERNILGFVGVAPMDHTLVGCVGAMSAAAAKSWLARLRRMGEQAG